MVGRVSELAEEAKVAIRNVRRDGNKTADQSEKDKDLSEDDRDQVKEQIQDLTKQYEAQATGYGQGPRKRGHGELSALCTTVLPLREIAWPIVRQPFTPSPGPSATRANTSPGGCWTRGRRVVTLTNSLVARQSLRHRGAGIAVHFDQPELLAEHLQRRVRPLQHLLGPIQPSPLPHADAVRNTLVLFEAAREAGVAADRPREHHQPSADSPLEYFRGKASWRTPSSTPASPTPSCAPPSSSAGRTS